MTDNKSVALTAITELQSLPHPWIDSHQLKEIEVLLNEARSKDLTNRTSHLHFSASALVFVDGHLFFIRHPYLETTLLPAGHVDPGELPFQAALREFQEETGHQVDEAAGYRLIDMNLFHIPANPIKHEGEHHHIDFRYLFTLKDSKPQEAELPYALLTQKEAPDEFKPYYALIK